MRQLQVGEGMSGGVAEWMSGKWEGGERGRVEGGGASGTGVGSGTRWHASGASGPGHAACLSLAVLQGGRDCQQAL